MFLPISSHSLVILHLNGHFAILKQTFRNLKLLQIWFCDKKSILWAVSNATSPAVSNGILWREKSREISFLALQN